MDSETESNSTPVLKPGRYLHFKGGEYQVVELARDAQSEQWLVIYRALYGERGLWVRPLAMFNDYIERDGMRQRRFEYVGEL